jgi:hypothetical protein
MTESLVVLSTSRLTMLAPAIAGVAGVAVGGWITYVTTMRRERAAQTFEALAYLSGKLRGVVTSLNVALAPKSGNENDAKPMNDAHWILGEARTGQAGVDLHFPPDAPVAQAAGTALDVLEEAVDACTKWRVSRMNGDHVAARKSIKETETAIAAFNSRARDVLWPKRRWWWWPRSGR